MVPKKTVPSVSILLSPLRGHSPRRRTLCVRRSARTHTSLEGHDASPSPFQANMFIDFPITPLPTFKSWDELKSKCVSFFFRAKNVITSKTQSIFALLCNRLGHKNIAVSVRYEEGGPG